MLNNLLMNPNDYVPIHVQQNKHACALFTLNLYWSLEMYFFLNDTQ
jgi:hypothetical protein